MIPGDPARVMAGTDADAAGLEEIRAKYGLPDPIPLQYLRWVGLALRGDLGESIRTRQSVAWTVAIKVPITVELACLALLIALSLAIPAGVIAAVRRNTAWDVLASAVSLCGVSIPNFWLGIMLILLVSVRLGWLPASGFVPLFEDPFANVTRMIMPALVLGTALAAVLMRQTRNAMIEVLSADYIRTARSKGLAGFAVVVRHALRNGLIPVFPLARAEAPAARSGVLHRAWLVGRRRPAALAGAVVVLLFVVMALGAPWIAITDPVRTDWSQIRKAPTWARPFGTDDLGRDGFSRVVWGARISMQAGVFSILLAIGIGVPVGLVAGYYRGALDQAIMRLTDAWLAFPFLILAIGLVTILGPSLTKPTLGIGLGAPPTYLRLTRGLALSTQREACGPG